MNKKTIGYIFAAICVVSLVGCNTTPVQDGAIVGGALGAGLGAIAGSTMGRTGEGALIGAGAGALTGALVGDHIEKSTAPRPVVYHSAPPPPPTLRSHAGRYEVHRHYPFGRTV